MVHGIIGIEKDSLVELILHEKPLMILLGLKYSGGKAYPAMLSKYADCTYSHTVKILNVLKENGLINFEKDGRIKYAILTERGEEVAFLLDQIYQKLTKISREIKRNQE